MSYETEFRTESYLGVIFIPRFRIALSKLKSCSHNLEIERGRYVRPKKNVDQRVCLLRNVLDDEIHFVQFPNFTSIDHVIMDNESSKINLRLKTVNSVTKYSIILNDCIERSCHIARNKILQLLKNRNMCYGRTRFVNLTSGGL